MAEQTPPNSSPPLISLASRWGKHEWVAVAIAAGFFLLSLCLSIWAFSLPCLVPHQQWLLNIFLPILGALAATFVSGAIVVTIRQKVDAYSLAVTAAGGLAVWLILFGTAPRSLASCTINARIIDKALLDEIHIQKINNQIRIAKLEKKQFNNIEFKNGNERVFLYALAEVDADALKIPGSRLEASAVVVFDGKITDNVPIWELLTLADWQTRRLIQLIGLDRVRNFVAAHGGTPRPGKELVPIMAILSCLTPAIWPGGGGHIEVHLKIALSATQEKIPLQSTAATGTCRD